MKKKEWAPKQKTILFIVLILSFLFLVSVVMGKYNEEKLRPDMITYTQQTQTPKTTLEPKQASQPVPTTTPNTRPTSIPVPRPTDCYDKSHDIWHPCNPSSYITPDNEWVKYYASQLYIQEDGRIKYKNKPYPLEEYKGNVEVWTDEPFVNNYDFTIYGNVDKNNVPWLMPDYYLAKGQRGVCSAWSLAVTSLMLSGEMSIKDGSNFIKQVIPAKIVLGYNKIGLRDAWIEYKVYDTSFISKTSIMKTDLFGGVKSATEFVKKDDIKMYPVFEFTDTYFRSV